MSCLGQVSVVIPSHNRANLVSRAIKSVLAQEDVDVELIVVDDASTDGTKEVLDRFAGSIRAILNQEPTERGAARNMGADAATHEWIAFLDSDDEWTERKLATQLQRLGARHASVTGVMLVNEHGQPTGIRRVPPRDAPKRIAWENPYFGGPSSVLLRRSVFHQVGGFVTELDVQGSEDWVFFATLVSAGISIDIVREPLVSYRVHQANSTGDPGSVARSMWNAVELMNARGLIPTRLEAKSKARTALTIARGFAAHKDWHSTGVWAKRSIRASPKEAVPTMTKLAATAAKGAWRRARR